MAKTERYEYIRAIVDGADLRWEYKLKGELVPASIRHDEDVSEFSQRDIEKLTASFLCVEPDDQKLIKVLYA